MSENAESTLENEIGRYFELKPDSIGPPNLYLGGHLQKVVLNTGVKTWVFGSTQYVQAAVKTIEEYLTKNDQSLKAKALDSLPNGYRPEIDILEELGPKEASYCQSLIGILQRMVELDQVDICTEVSMMPSHLLLSQKGHLDAVFHMFAYLKKHPNSEIVFDSSEPNIDMANFPCEDWILSIYSDVKEDMSPTCPFAESGPANMPAPRDVGFTITAC